MLLSPENGECLNPFDTKKVGLKNEIMHEKTFKIMKYL